MSTIVSFKDLNVWKKSHLLVLEIYRMTSTFPKEEIYALTSQMRRAAVSIPANIAEGFTKKSYANKMHYLSHSQGSLEEIKYYLILSRDLIYMDNERFMNADSICEEVSKLISGYAKSIKNFYNSDSDHSDDK